MHNYKAEVEVILSFKIGVEGAFNENYRSGRENAEKQAEDIVLDMLPKEFSKIEQPRIDAICREYELTGKEAEEVDNDR